MMDVHRKTAAALACLGALAISAALLHTPGAPALAQDGSAEQAPACPQDAPADQAAEEVGEPSPPAPAQAVLRIAAPGCEVPPRCVLAYRDGACIELPADEAGVVSPEALAGLGAGEYLLGVEEGWSVTGATLDAGLETERAFEAAEGGLTVSLPLTGAASLILLVEHVEAAAPDEADVPAPAEPDTAPVEEPLPAADPGDAGESPEGPDMSGALATGMPASNGASCDPLSCLLDVVSRLQSQGSGVRVVWCDSGSGSVGYAAR